VASNGMAQGEENKVKEVKKMMKDSFLKIEILAVYPCETGYQFVGKVLDAYEELSENIYGRKILLNFPHDKIPPQMLEMIQNGEIVGSVLNLF
jgi:hypothetical protein